MSPRTEVHEDMIALIIGRANSVWDDLDEAEHLLKERDAHVIVINGVGVDYKQHIEHWVSFHAELFPYWIEARKQKGYSDDYQLWTSARGRKVMGWEKAMGINTGIKMVECDGGSSGMIALLVAQAIGAGKIILAGIPMDNSYGHYDKAGAWDEAEMHKKAWEKIAPELKDKIRSMSGWTRKFFGYPTEDWLCQ